MTRFPETSGPPPHILDLLEPAMEIRRRSPLRDPYDTDYWWRVLPNNNSPFHRKPLGSIWEQTRRIEPEEAVLTAERHFEFLRGIGIENANIQQILSQGPRGPRLFSCNEHVTGASSLDLVQHKELRPMFRLIGNRLLHYANWVDTSTERFILFDLPRPKQYIYGTTVSIASPETILIDTDPFLAVATSQELSNFRDRADQMVHR